MLVVFLFFFFRICIVILSKPRDTIFRGALFFMPLLQVFYVPWMLESFLKSAALHIE